MPKRYLPIRVPISLRNLFPGASFVGCGDIRVSAATDVPDRCTPNSLFVNAGDDIPHAEMIAAAIARGASSILVHRPLPSVRVPQCIVPNVRQAYGTLCAALAGFPSLSLSLAAVTGTHGKTSVAWLLRSILETSGHRTGLLCSIEHHDGVRSSAASLEGFDTGHWNGWLASIASQTTTHAAVEVPDEAFADERTAGTKFDVAVAMDHVDGRLAKLLDHLKPGGWVALNTDSVQASAPKRATHSPRVRTFGLGAAAEVSATILEESLDGARAIIKAAGESHELRTPLVGRQNVSNCLAAITAAQRFDVSLAAACRGIEAVRVIPGRMERIDCGQPYDIFVDDARTGEAITSSVESLRRLTSGRVICVAGSHAAPACSVELIRYAGDGRNEAIRNALAAARTGDCVFIAGRDSERNAAFAGSTIPFIDREAVRAILTRRQPSSICISA